MMRLRNILAILLLTLVSGACLGDRITVEQPSLLIRVRFPALPEIETKAGASEFAAELESETAIKDLQIWIFLHDDFAAERKSGYCIGYLNSADIVFKKNYGSDPLTGFENRYYVNIDKDIAQQHPAVDVYALGNSGNSSINPGSFNENTTRDYLDKFVINGNYYGIKGTGTPTHTSVPNGGLPYSAVGKNMQMKGSYPVMNLDVVTLKRAVSKFRFVICQLSDAAGPVTEFNIEELSLDEGQIATSEFLFNDSQNEYKIDASVSPKYLAKAAKFTAPAYADVALNQSPQEYAYTPGQTQEEYEKVIYNGLKANVLTDLGKCYLRETDQPLAGRIKYTMPGVAGTQEKTFSMSEAGGFARNHSWIVYIYFLRDEMTFTVSWNEWLPGQDFNLYK